MSKFKKGDKVIVINWGAQYFSNEEATSVLGMKSCWEKDYQCPPQKWTTARTMATVRHTNGDTIVGIQPVNSGYCYLVHENGLELEECSVRDINPNSFYTDEIDAACIKGFQNYKRDTGDTKFTSNKKTIMQKLTPMLKTMLDKKGRTLYKAGFLNGDLALTAEGKNALDAILFEAHKDELVTLAEEAIKESKEK